MIDIYLNNSAKVISVPTDVYTWLRDISDPCVLRFDEEIGLDTVDADDFEWWSNLYQLNQDFYEMYSQASDEHKKIADVAMADQEFNDRATVGIATLKNLGY